MTAKMSEPPPGTSTISATPAAASGGHSVTPPDRRLRAAARARKNNMPLTLADELRRKAVHLAAIGIPIAYYFVPRTLSTRILLGVFLVLLFIDLVRLQTPRVRWLISRFLGDILRGHESRDLLASTYMVLASLLTLYIVPQKQVAIAALAFMVVGDTSAALVGRRWGRIRYFGKSLEGSLACFVACVLAGAVVLQIPPPAEHALPALTWSVMLAGAFFATVFEALPIPLDDNFSVPLAAGIAMMTILGSPG